MASHFTWYSSQEERTVPFNARYAFPSQANKSVKMTPRIPPKNGGTFYPGNVIRLEFPAQGYVNPLNTTMEFDVTLISHSNAEGEILRFQNSIQSIFSRVRLLYGSTSLEDIVNYNVIVRALTEWTGTNQTNTMDQASIAEGVGGIMPGYDRVGITDGLTAPRLVNVRQNFIQGIDSTGVDATSTPNASVATGITPTTGAYTSTRRYQISFALGLFTQDKLLPTKWMASQLAIELTLENAASCLINFCPAVTLGSEPTYAVTGVNLIPEILEFDSSYDAMFLKGLMI
jgi:hypothetical protein